MSHPTGTILIFHDVNARWGDQQTIELARHLEPRLNQPVVLCDPDRSETSLIDAIRQFVETGLHRVVVLSPSLLTAPHRKSLIASLSRALQEWPHLRIHVSTPLTWLDWSDWLRTSVLDAVNGLALSLPNAAVLLVGEASPSPVVNADVSRTAHLLLEGSEFGRVTYAFTGRVRPGVPDALRDLARIGFRHVAIVPWMISAGEPLDALRREVFAAAHAGNLNARIVVPALAHFAFVNLLVAGHRAALSAVPLQSLEDSSFSETPSTTDNSPSADGMTDEEIFELERLSRRIDAILPPEYQGRYETVAPRSMGSASLKFDSEGKVAWDEIWTSFCDLALAGGPPHRGTLLEAVPAADAIADRTAYDAVVAEMERGIRLTTGLPVVTSCTPGWVGVQCQNEEMAVWLMRAIIVENVMVRREGETLFLPAGPKFTVTREIKNVITTIAKTVHYWTAHLKARGPARKI